MTELIPFKKMMEIIQEEGFDSFVKSSFEKRAKWKQIPGAPLPDHDIIADHVIAYNSKKTDDGTYHPEYVTAPDSNVNQVGGEYPAYLSKWNLNVNIPSIHSPALNLSRRNSGKIKGSNGFIDNQFEHGDYWSKRNDLRGFTAHINPTTHRIINSVDDWLKFVREHPVTRQYKQRGKRSEDWYFPDWIGHSKDKVKSVEYTRAFFDGLKDDKNLKKLYDARIGVPSALFGEPQIAVLHPDAIRSTEPYKWSDHAQSNDKTYKRLESIHNVNDLDINDMDDMEDVDEEED